MLLSLKIKNLKSICSADISFEKSGIEYRSSYILNNRIVNPLAFYGENGSGKSTVLLAFQYLTIMMNNDKDMLSKITYYSDFFALDEAAKRTKGNFKANVPFVTLHFLTKNGFEFKYSFAAMMRNILEEKLIEINGEGERLLLSRKLNKFYIGSEKEARDIATDYSAVRKIGIEDYENGDLAKIKKCYEQLSKIIYIDHEGSIFADFTNEVTIDEAFSNKKYMVASNVSKFSNLPKFEFFQDKSPDGDNLLAVRFFDGKEMPFHLLSNGTKNESRILLALDIASKDSDYIVVTDEIDRCLHPISLRNIIEEYANKNIQLIFSSHASSLLKFFRPDQIYFAHYNSDYCSEYKRLNQIFPNIREINNIESMYLKGIFDGDIKN